MEVVSQVSIFSFILINRWKFVLWKWEYKDLWGRRAYEREKEIWYKCSGDKENWELGI